ncbi:MAG TPA: choice-of-anchor Q domain-containing protein, partial [Armatimonadota bacterium]
MKLAAAIALALVAVSASWGSVFRVSRRTASPSPDGLSWATAFPTVQQGVDAAVSGDEIWVAAGTYKENLLIRTGRALYGGFTGTETERSGRNWSRNVAILDGAQKDRVVTLIGGTGSAEAITVDGFTIEKGASRSGGGGVYISGNACIVNNIIIGNTAVSDGFGWGGGIGIQDGAVAISNCIMIGNLADQGGALAPGGSAAGADPVKLWNCTVVGNRSGQGGAISAGWTTTLALINCVLAHNDSGIINSRGSVSLRNCDVYGNSAYNFSGLADPTGTNGNISADPMLSTFASGLHLQPGSPCIDAGDDSVVTGGQLDLYGKPRLLGAHVDMGADESDGSAYPPHAPRVWRVSTAGSDDNDGSSWSSAIASVSLALLYAEAGDEVWAAAGTYFGSSALKSGVGLYGGFAGSETDRTQRDPKQRATILDGTIATLGAYIYGATV